MTVLIRFCLIESFNIKAGKETRPVNIKAGVEMIFFKKTSVQWKADDWLVLNSKQEGVRLV
jgi:hypothetical protein